MDREKIERIGELSRKSRVTALTDDELAEQKALREEYLLAVRQNFRSVLENIEFADERK